MSAKTGIEWTDRTWNPLTGCTKVSPGCDHCYAKTMHERFHGPGSFDTVTLHPERLGQPLRWRDPARVFVNSMSDLFHDDVPDEYIARVFAVMALAPQHSFQVLTKRHARMRALLSRESFQADVLNARTVLALDHGRSSMEPLSWPLPSVWLGVSVETQQWADIRIPALIHTPAAVRFLSCEPLLGPVDLGRWVGHDALCPRGLGRNEGECDGCNPTGGIDWVIVGGESGPGARPMHPDWARSIRDECVDAGVPFLFKQWGAWVPTNGQAWPAAVRVDHDGTTQLNIDAGCVLSGQEIMRRVGKGAAGRLLDGRTWDEYPERAA